MKSEFAPDLTPSEREILWSVYSVVKASGVSPGTDQLARGSGKTAAQVSALIGGLMGKGYLQRQHKSKFEARLTDKSLDAFGALMPAEPATTHSPYYLPPNTPEADRVTVLLDQNTFGCLCALQTEGESQDECIRRLIWEAWRRS